MPSITETKLNLALGETASAPKRYEARFQNQGLGRLDRWLSHVQGAKDPIRARSASKIAEPKSIILPQLFLPGEVHDETDLAILSSLLRYRKVYLWRGPGQPLSKPLTSTAEFWEGRERHTPAAQEEIEQEFGKLHLSEKHWLVVDKSRYADLKKKVKELDNPFAEPDLRSLPFLMLHEDEEKSRTHADTYLDLVNCQLSDSDMLARYIRSVDPMKITSLKLRAPTTKELIALMKHFPALDEITVVGVTQPWLEGLEGLQAKTHHLHLIVAETTGKFETIPVHLFKKITYVQAKKATIKIAGDTVEKPSCLEELTIKEGGEITLIGGVNRTLKKIDLSKVEDVQLKYFKLLALEELTLKNASALEYVCRNFASEPPLKSLKFSYGGVLAPKSVAESYTPFLPLLFPDLSVFHGNFEDLDDNVCTIWCWELEKLNKLEDLRLTRSRIEPAQLAKLSNLKVLYLKKETQFTGHPLTLTNHPELTHLKLDSCVFDAAKTDFSGAPKLETIELQHQVSGENKFDFSSCPQLKNIRIQNKDLTKIYYVEQNLSGDADYTIVPPTSGSLQKLDVSTSKPVHIDFSNCTQLNTLNVTFLQNYKDLKKCPRLKFVRLENTTIDSSPLNLGTVDCLDLVDCKVDKLDFNQSRIKQLRIEITPSMGGDDSEKSTISLTNAQCLQILDLDIDDDYDIAVSLEECVNLRVLKISNCHMLEEKNFPRMEFLEELVITSNWSIKALDLTKFPNLKRLVVTGTCIAPATMTFPKQCLIESIQLDHDSNRSDDSSEYKTGELDLSHCSHLKNFKMVGCPDTRLQGLPCEQLEELEINDYYHEIKGVFPKLKKASITSTQAVTLEQTKELRQLTVHKRESLWQERVSESDVDIFIPKSNAEAPIDLRITHSPNLQAMDLKNVTPAGVDACQALRSVNFLGATDTQRHLSRVLPDVCQTYFASSENSKAEQKQDYNSIRAANYRNQNSTVSCFNYDPDGAGVDAKTTNRDDEPYASKGMLKLELLSQNPISFHEQRIRVLNQIKYENGKLIFYTEHDFHDQSIKPTAMTDINRNELIEWKNKNPKNALANFSGTIKKGIKYPLGPNQPLKLDETTDFLCNDTIINHIEIKWDKATQQFYVALKEDYAESTANIEILYPYVLKPNYRNLPPSFSPLEQKNTLPIELTRAIDQLKVKLDQYREKEKKPHRLEFLFSTKSTKEKLRDLIEYCKFKPEKLDPTPRDDDIEILIETLWQGRGSCRHSSKAFVAVAQWLGIPANLIGNEMHMLGELPDADGNYYSQELGGEEYLDVTEPAVRASRFQAESKKIVEPTESKASSEPENPLLLKEKKLSERYAQIFRTLTEKSEIKSINSVLGSQLLAAPLLHLASHHHPFAVDKQIKAELKPGTPHFYIHNAEEFNTFWQSYRLEKGKRTPVPGPLQAFIKEGGVLVVNWTNFTADQLVSYKSILDAKPTLHGKPISKNLKVIGLIQDDLNAGSAFLSRCQPFTLHADFFKTSPMEPKKEIKGAEQVHIKLHGRDDWRESFLAKVEDDYTLREGKLLEAIRKAKDGPTTFTIENPPDDDDFAAWLHRIQVHKRIFFNGEPIDIPDTLEVKTEHKPLLLQLENVALSKAVEEKSAKKKIFIGLHNWHELYEKGFLENFDAKKTVIYITSFIPKGDWAALLDHMIESGYKHRFEFELAPGAEIEDVFQNQDPPRISEHSNITVSNDPDYGTVQLQKQLAENKENAKIVYITPQTTLSDLIVNRFIVPDEKDPDKVAEKYEEKRILHELKQGTSIILSGEMSFDLYQQLLPLLSGKPEGYIHFKGQDHTIKGSLYAVLPQQVLENYKLLEYQSRQCSLQAQQAESKSHIPYNLDEKNPHVQQIKAFYDLVLKLPHTGKLKPILSFQRIQSMLKALKDSKLHPHNPIKGIFLYDYPKKSADYAYLNVMGKYIFRPEDATPVRKEKLLHLLKKIKTEQDFKDNIWHLLNCFNGAELVSILGKDLEQALVYKPYPELSPTLYASLQEKIAALQQAPAEEKAAQPLQKSHVAKRERELEVVLARSHMVFLKGVVGAGKTETAKKKISELGYELKNHRQIKEFLAAKKPTALLLDEANLVEPGTWDFLKGFSPDQRLVYYQGEWYELGDHQKVIFTGNPETDPEREYHPFLQSYAETLYFDTPEDAFLAKMGLATLPTTEFNAIFLAAFHLAKELNPLYAYSIRDLQSAARKLLLSEKPTLATALKANIDEYIGSLGSSKQREEFAEKLAAQFDVAWVPKTSHDLIPVHTPKMTYYFPQEIEYILQLIQQAMDINEYELKKPTGYHKQCVLIEGKPGLGKSTLYRAMLEQAGYIDATTIEEKAPPTEKKFYHVTLDNAGSAKELLRKAFHEGAYIILDELNAGDDIEQELIKMLTEGVDGDGNPPARRGMMIFASQNPSSDKGVKALSPALLNRSHVIYMDRFSEPALVSSARQLDIEGPELFVKEFEASQKRSPKITTMRTFRLASESAQPTPSLDAGLDARARLFTPGSGVSSDEPQKSLSFKRL